MSMRVYNQTTGINSDAFTVAINTNKAKCTLV